MKELALRSGVVIGLRPSTQADEPFMYRAFMMQILRAHPFSSWSTENVDAHRKNVIEPIVGGLGCIIACDLHDPGVCLGYIAYHGNVLHMVYVKGKFRGMGICSELLDNSLYRNRGSIYYTHQTSWMSSNRQQFKHIRDKHGMVYDPYRCHIS